MFPIIDVPAGTVEVFEQLGTKAKFWYADPQLGRSLFKCGRANTGENWAEKLACELASLLGLPHAYYELARYEGQFGVVSPNFVPRYGRLILGNELLATAKLDAGNNAVRFYRARAHTITFVLAFMKVASMEKAAIRAPKDFEPFDAVATAGDVFAGYLMFDAWIGNQDRHDENWGLVTDPTDGEIYLAPSFDHGSSLARNETDKSCADMLATRDQGRHVSAYVKRARSAVYPHGAGEKTKALTTLEAFGYCLKFSPEASQAWLRRLQSVEEHKVVDIIEMIPDEFISEGRRGFVAAYLALNQQRLLALLKP